VAIPLPNDQQEQETQRVISPFAQTTATVSPTGKRRSSHWLIWTLGIVLGLAALGAGAYFIEQYLNDPYRTLEPFPVDRYMSDYHSLTGSKFKADAKVDNDLGWKANTGRLMVFTFDNDTRPLVVLIPPKLANIYFTKGQTYRTSLEVEDGGLIYAVTCEKD
jgi:hypothetical protein